MVQFGEKMNKNIFDLGDLGDLGFLPLSLDTGKMALLKKFRSEKVIMNVPLHFKAFLCPVPKLWDFS